MAIKMDPLNKKFAGAVTPMLTVADVKAAVNFYQKAFGFAKRGIMNGPDGKPMHAELTLRGSTLMLGPENAEHLVLKRAALSSVLQDELLALLNGLGKKNVAESLGDKRTGKSKRCSGSSTSVAICRFKAGGPTTRAAGPKPRIQLTTSGQRRTRSRTCTRPARTYLRTTPETSLPGTNGSGGRSW